MSEEIYSLSTLEKKLKDGIYRLYFQYYLKAKEKNYERFIILMQVGDFYEVYGYELPELRIGNIREVSRIMNISVTTKSTQHIKKHTIKTPLMSGFGVSQIEKYTNLLKRNNYIIYHIVQEDIPGKDNKNRILKEIISPGTNTQPEINDNLYLFAIYLEQWNNMNTIGISYIDASTGKSYVHYFQDTKKDPDYGFNQIIRILKSTNPKEILIYNENLNTTEKKIIQDLEIREHILVRYFTKDSQQIDQELFKIGYQENRFDEIFKAKKGMLSIFDYLEFGPKTETQHSFMLLLYVIDQYNSKLLENINKPQFIFEDTKLILDTNTVEQLNLVDNNYSDNLTYRNKKYSSVFQVINYTKTSIGHRYLKNKLINPDIDIQKIQDKYDMCKELGENYNTLNDILEHLPDFERLHRKIHLETITLRDFYNLHEGYENFNKLYQIKFSKIKKYIENTLPKKDLNNYMKIYKKNFNISNMNIYGFHPYKNIFKKGIYTDLDKLFKQKQDKIDIFQIVQKEYIKFFRENLKSFRKNTKYVSIKETGVKIKTKYLRITNGNYKKLQKKIMKDKLKKYKISFENKTYFLSDFTYEKPTKNDIKISHPLLDYKKIEEVDIDIKKLTKKYFLEIMKKYSNTYQNIFNKIVDIVGKVDFTYSNAKCADKNNYIQPEIIDSNEAFFDIKNMRHPMIEHLCNDIYKPFDLKLNDEKLGLILSGINGVGKSSYIKTAGIMITLAQMGYYVPCTKMKYSIFTQIMTRIIGNDNILTNSSSFQVEMKELRSILNRGNNKTLVLVDELCRGTEHNSSVGLTIGVIDEFSKYMKNRFIITTHLHKIFDYLDEYNNILIKHISIKKENGKLIYDRKLKNGPSPSDYGLLVAEAMNIEQRVIEKARKVRNKIDDKPSEFMITKKSRYNSSKIMYKCEKCGTNKNLHTDHIKQQCLANDKGFFPDGTHKNKKANLQVLCDKCHKIKTKMDKN